MLVFYGKSVQHRFYPFEVFNIFAYLKDADYRKKQAFYMNCIS